MSDAKKKKAEKGKSKKQHQGPAGEPQSAAPPQSGGAGPKVANRKEAVSKGAAPARRSQK